MGNRWIIAMSVAILVLLIVLTVTLILIESGQKRLLRGLYTIARRLEHMERQPGNIGTGNSDISKDVAVPGENQQAEKRWESVPPAEKKKKIIIKKVYRLPVRRSRK